MVGVGGGRSSSVEASSVLFTIPVFFPQLSESVVNRMKDPKMGHPAPSTPPPAAAGGTPHGQEKGMAGTP